MEASSGVLIDDLPDEVLVKILSHSTAKELIDVVQNVCTRWKRLSDDPELWRDKTFSIDSSCSDDEAVLMLQQMPELRALVVKRAVESSVIEALGNYCNHLTTLKLHRFQHLRIPLERLVQKCANIQSLRIPVHFLSCEGNSQTLAQLKQLQSLNIPTNWTTDIHFLPQLLPLAGCPQLSRLKVDGNIAISFKDMECFTNMKCKALTHLTLPWSSSDKRCVVLLLKDCTSLRHLELDDCSEFGDEAAEAFTALGCLKNLRTLVMTNLQRYPAGAPALAFQSGGLSRLQVLSISDSDLEDSTLLAVCMHCPELRKLYLCSNCKLTNEGLRQFYRLSKLEVLELSQCVDLRGGGMECVAQLANLRKLFLDSYCVRDLCDLQKILDIASLKVLDLCDTVIDDSFLERIPEELINLRHLDVRRVGMRDALDRLQERMPGLQLGTYKSEHEWKTDFESE